MAFIAALLEDVAKKHALDPKRVYSTGISNGAIFSHYLAANLSSRIAAIAPVAGGLAEPFSAQFKATEPVSVLILQGTADPLVPYAGGGINLPGGKQRVGIVSTEEAVKKWVATNGCKLQPAQEEVADTDPQDGCRATKYTYAGGQGGSEVVLYRIEGGGHTWPGGIQYLGERRIGKLCRDFDATPVMWEFFKAHPKP